MSNIPPSLPPYIIQGSKTGPTPAGLTRVTSPILLPQGIEYRMRHFPNTTYNLNNNSHLVKFMRVLLGNAGTGQLRKKMMMARLGEDLTSSYFYDLDGFWGAIFGLGRTPTELLTVNPYTDLTDSATWRQQHANDQSYKDRIFQFGKAIGYGPSPIGMQLIAEAILNVPCDIYESYLYADQIAQTYTQLEGYTFNQLEAFTYTQLEGNIAGVANSNQRLQFIIRPHRTITLAESYALQHIINKIKPADSLLKIDSLGVEVFDTVPLRGAWASNHYWDITATVKDIITNNPVEIPTPVFGHHQGEAWLYNSDFAGVLDYHLDVDGSNLESSSHDRVSWNDGTYTDFLPILSLITVWETQISRYARDVVAQANPLAGRGIPQVGQRSTVSPLVIDGKSIQDLSIQLKNEASEFAHNISDALRFWATPTRDQDDDTYDVIEIRLGTPHVVNSINFEASHFPQIISVQAYDNSQGTWVQVYTQTVSDSIPAVLEDNEDFRSEKIHPQHSAEGHWLPIVARINNTTCDRVRIVLTRQSLNGPVIERNYPRPNLGSVLADQIKDSVELRLQQAGIHWEDESNHISRIPVPYSLAIRNLGIGYVVDSIVQLPVPAPGPATIDISNSITYSAYEELASGPIQAIPSQWRCDPQPVGNAVINYWVDTRDNLGNPQVIDRFYVDPTHLNVHCTLYWSNDVPPSDGGWTAADDILPLGIATYTGNITNDINGVQFSKSDPSFIDIQNQNLQWNPNNPWWAGLYFRDTLGAQIDHPIIDLGVAQVSIQNQILKLHPSNGDSDVTIALNYPPNTMVNLIIGWLPTGSSDFPGGSQWILQIKPSSGVKISNIGPSTHSLIQPLTIRIGALLSTSLTQISGINLNNLVLKGETLTNNTVAGWIANPSYYTVKGQFRSQDLGGTKNAYLRIDPSFISSYNPGGLVGGPPNFCDGLTWTPVPRDFILTKGYLTFDPTLASFWKFELTNLAAEPFETFIPILKPVRTFPHMVIAASVPFTSLGYKGNQPVGSDTLSNLAHQGRYLLSGTSVSNAVQTTPQPTDFLPTEALVANDPNLAFGLGQYSWIFNIANTDQGFSSARFTTPTVHNYLQTDIAHTSKLGFFCGFKSLKALRAQYTVDDDTGVYDEKFLDGQHIALNQWTQNPGDITSGTLTLPVVVQSKPYLSKHMVEGIQFATTQSPPTQIITDDDFTDPALISSPFTSTDGWHTLGDSSISYDPKSTSVIIQRVVNPTPIIFTQPPTSIVLPTVSPVFGELSQAGGLTGSNLSYGGISSGLALASASGRLYVAVRFTALTNFSQPVYVQLLNGNDNTVILQWQVTGNLGLPVELYWPYDIGSIVPSNTPLRVAMVQLGKSNDSWKIDSLSLFDDGIVWEFSADGGGTWFKALGIQNLPSGVMRFKNPGNELVWRATGYKSNMHISTIRLRPIYQGQLSSRPEGTFKGPNLSPFDHEPDIYNDPLFNGWQKPIPQWWFIGFKNMVTLFPDGAPIITQYQRYYNRPITEDFSSTFTDSSIAHTLHNPFANERFDLFYRLTDSNLRAAIYLRNQAETTPVSDSVVGLVTRADLISPIVAPAASNTLGAPQRH